MRPAGPIVVDASVAVQWFSAESESARAARLLEDSLLLIAPDIMPIEAAGAWHRKLVAGEFERRDFHSAVAQLLALRIELLPSLSLLKAAANLADDLRHPVVDCIYLIIARDREARLATADAKLAKVAARIGLALWTG